MATKTGTYICGHSEGRRNGSPLMLLYYNRHNKLLTSNNSFITLWYERPFPWRTLKAIISFPRIKRYPPVSIIKEWTIETVWAWKNLKSSRTFPANEVSLCQHGQFVVCKERENDFRTLISRATKEPLSFTYIPRHHVLKSWTPQPNWRQQWKAWQGNLIFSPSTSVATSMVFWLQRCWFLLEIFPCSACNYNWSTEWWLWKISGHYNNYHRKFSLYFTEIKDEDLCHKSHEIFAHILDVQTSHQKPWSSIRTHVQLVLIHRHEIARRRPASGASGFSGRRAYFTINWKTSGYGFIKGVLPLFISISVAPPNPKNQ